MRLVFRLLLVSLVLLSCCSPRQAKVRENPPPPVRKVAVVPLEAPALCLPLEYDPGSMEKEQPDQGKAKPAARDRRGGSRKSVKGLEEERARDNWVAMQPSFYEGGKWHPTVALAKEAIRRLGEGSTAEADLVPGVRTFLGFSPGPGVRSRRDWSDLVEIWYRGEMTRLRYPDLAGRGYDGVLEIGIQRYEMDRDSLRLEVRMRLVDPSTGRLLACGSCERQALAGAPGRLFGEGGGAFRAVFEEMCRPMVFECLRKIGLVPQKVASGRPE